MRKFTAKATTTDRSARSVSPRPGTPGGGVGVSDLMRLE